MNGKKILYNVINSAVILLTTLLFVYDFRNVEEVFYGRKLISVVILIITVLLVHGIKAVRLYLILYGNDVEYVSYMKTYCKVTPVSVVIPFKLGEFFRMYCYGKQLGDVLKGVVIILLDRFMDTIALVTVILLVWAFYGGQVTSFVYILLIFLVSVLLIYFVYPSVYKFWKQYLLRAKASEHKLTILRLLETLNKIYSEIENVAKGRGIILYFTSLIAWVVEIGSMTLLNGISQSGEVSQMILDYLASAMSGNQLIELKQFVITSVVLLIILYLFIKAGEMIFGKAVRK